MNCFKKFGAEFKAFITRGNVVDLAVGVIIGSAFTAIVTALTTYILQPIINWIIFLCMGDDADTAYTMLHKAYAEDGVTIDLTNSIYIDWGAFISAIINFILVALVLFFIIKAINAVNAKNSALKTEGQKQKEVAKRAKEIKKSEHISYADAKAKAEKLIAEEEAAKKAEEEAKKAEAEKNKAPTTEELLAQIRDLLAENKTAETDTAKK